jgi:hypothetical protein
VVNSRLKGNKAERDVIKILSKYFPGKFERRSLGIAGSDIVCPDSFRYAPEVKHRKTVKALHLLIGKNKMLNDWWKQADHQAKVAEKHTLLIVKCEGKWFCTEFCPAQVGHWMLLEDWCKHPIE